MGVGLGVGVGVGVGVGLGVDVGQGSQIPGKKHLETQVGCTPQMHGSQPLGNGHSSARFGVSLQAVPEKLLAMKIMKLCMESIEKNPSSH